MSQDEKQVNKSDVNGKYFYAVGKRKSAIAQVRVYPKGSGKVTINDREIDQYFTTVSWKETALSPLTVTGLLKDSDVTVTVHGGGIRGQADAVRHGIARAVVLMDELLRPQIKKQGYLTRDARIKERKKFGLHGARRAPQWSKR